MQRAEICMTLKVDERESQPLSTRAQVNGCEMRSMQDVFYLLDAEQLDLKLHGGTWGDDAPGTALAVRQSGWDHQSPRAAHRHRRHSVAPCALPPRPTERASLPLLRA